MAGKVSVLVDMVAPVIQTLGYRLWGVEYIGQGKHSLLRVYIDKDEGINVDDCALVSRQISSLLDVEDPVSGHYTLEVSSPGMDRPLFEMEHYREFIGHQVKVRLRQGFENRRNFSGQIKAVENDEIILIMGNEELSLPFELIEKANIESRI